MLALFGFFVILLGKCFSRVPPAACLEKPRFDDCGTKPVPVMYYYKSGSRCEVGFWRGCYPNLNMFKDEFECVSKCIFGSRAEADDYHNHMNDIYDEIPADIDEMEDQTPEVTTEADGTIADTMKSTMPSDKNDTSEVKQDETNIDPDSDAGNKSPNGSKAPDDTNNEVTTIPSNDSEKGKTDSGAEGVVENAENGEAAEPTAAPEE